MRSCIVLVLAAGCAATRAAAPAERAPHASTRVEPAPPPAQIIQPTFQPEVSAKAPHVSVSDPSHQISDADRSALHHCAPAHTGCYSWRPRRPRHHPPALLSQACDFHCTLLQSPQLTTSNRY